MKKAFHNIISVSMALLVLLSTTSFTVDKHYCGSFLVDMAVFFEAETCGMEMNEASSSAAFQTASADNDYCCSNHRTEVEGQDELITSIKSLDFDQQVFLTTFTFSYINLFREVPEQIIPFRNYFPPLLVTDIHLVDQVFLI